MGKINEAVEWIDIDSYNFSKIIKEKLKLKQGDGIRIYLNDSNNIEIKRIIPFKYVISYKGTNTSFVKSEVNNIDDNLVKEFVNDMKKYPNSTISRVCLYFTNQRNYGAISNKERAELCNEFINKIKDYYDLDIGNRYIYENYIK